MPGNPSFQFYPGDWLKDPELSMCSPATRGVWIDLICAMHELERSGMLRGTAEQIARLTRCSTIELDHALAELQTTRAADVTFRNGNVTVTNRRMKRECDERKASADRQKRHRSNARDPTVTPLSRDSNAPSSSSSSNTPLSPPKWDESGFEDFWAAYPRKQAKESALTAWLNLAPDAALVQTILAAIEAHHRSDQWTRDGGKFIPHPANWLDGRRWEDDLSNGKPRGQTTADILAEMERRRIADG